MNKPISSFFAVALIVIAALTAFTCLELARNSIPEYQPFKLSSNPLTGDNQNKTACQTHAYQGEAKLKVWSVTEDNETTLRIIDEDTSKIPADDHPKIKLVDTNPALEKKLSNSSEKKPVEIKISGFATRCDGTALASLEYKDGIFRPYL